MDRIPLLYLIIAGVLTLHLSSEAPTSTEGSSGIDQFENYFNEVDMDSENADVETRNAASSKLQRWPNRTIYYAIAPDYTKTEANNVRQALEVFNERTCLTFEERKPRNMDKRRYIFYKKSPKMCGTKVGYNPLASSGSPHDVSLTSRCLEFVSVIQHESLHVLGLYHEQSRYDRDKYVRIVYSNIPMKYHLQFVTYPPIYTRTYNVPYDYESLMHYSANAFAADPAKPTIRAFEGGKLIDRKMGQMDGPSEGDIQKIRIMYECDD